MLAVLKYLCNFQVMYIQMYKYGHVISLADRFKVPSCFGIF